MALAVVCGCRSHPGGTSAPPRKPEESAQITAGGEPVQQQPAQPDTANTDPAHGGHSTEPPGASSRLERARRLFSEAQRAYEAGDFPRAARKLEQAYHLMPTPELAYDVARVYERMSHYEKAIEYYQKYRETARLEPQEAERIEARIAELREARRRLREQLFVAPPSRDELTREARLFFERGVALFRRGQLEAALEAFAAALQFAPLPEIHFNMAVVAEQLGRRQDAIDHYREYLRLRPDAPDRGDVERRVERLRAGRLRP